MPMIDTIASILAEMTIFQQEANEIATPPLEVQKSKHDYVLHREFFLGTRGYILQIVDQINLCYQHTCYDACAVMIRRLIEGLIIETYDKHKVENEICNSDGNYYFLDELISRFTSSPHWKIGRNTKSGLIKLKNIGDQSAHSRRYNAKRPYIDDVTHDLRVVTEEILYISGLKK
ncbi:MAG: DUF4145 domain-containing protein [Methylophilus sp.]